MPQAGSSSETIADGVCDFSAGVDSLKVPQLQSPINPNGLQRNQLAWLINATVRDGSIKPRDGWLFKGVIVGQKSLSQLLGSQFGGAFMYVPPSGTPYIMMIVGGNVIRVDPDFVGQPLSLSTSGSLTFPVSPKAYFCQAEQFLIIQGGDYNAAQDYGHLPLFWDGNILVESNGITGVTQQGTNEEPLSYTVNTTASWLPLNGAGTTTLQIQGPFAGNLWDNVDVVDSSGNALGKYRVTAVGASNITLTYLAGSVSTREAAGELTFTLVLADPDTQTLTLQPLTGSFTVNDTYGYTESGGNFFGPYEMTGIGYTSPYYAGLIFFAGFYSGSTPNWTTFVGQSVTFTWSGNPNFTFTGTINASLASSYNPGISGVSIDAFPSGESFSGSLSFNIPAQWTIPTGANVAVALAVNELYTGNVGDTISIANAGSYTVVSFNSTTLNLLSITPENPGQAGPTTLDITIESVEEQVGTAGVNQIPAALAMMYFQGIVFYAQGKTVSGGDIVDGPSGTFQYNYTDSVLYVTENPLSFGGDGFTMPAGSDQITGLAIPQMINASLGQGLLNVGTPNWIFSMYVPSNRNDWIAANQNNQPQINVVQSGSSTGFVNDWSVISVNGDLWYISPEAQVRSLLTAVRYFQQWGGVDLSSNEYRVLSLVNVALLYASSGIYFNNRVIHTTLPMQTPYGVAHQALLPLDLTTISTLEQQDPPNWEGHYEGLQVLQLVQGTFNNKARAFAVVLSPTVAGQIELWELVPNQIGDINQSQTNRIQWQATTAAFTWGQEFRLKKVVALELWIDQLIGNADIMVEYCPDSSSCWYQWAAFSLCSATSSTQDPNAPAYPPVQFQPGVRKPIVLPKPPEACEGQNSRPAYILYDCQLRFTVKGNLRIRGFVIHAEKVERELYRDIIRVATNWIKAMFRL